MHGWQCGSSGRAPAQQAQCQVQTPVPSKEKKKRAKYELMDWKTPTCQEVSSLKINVQTQ
jgi:hypothetical protein